MKIALVHDYLVQYGGAERVLECFSELFPDAPIYTLIYDKKAMMGAFAKNRIYTSRLQRLGFARRFHRLFPPLMPPAVEEFDFSKYDIVLSDSSSFAKGIITRPETLHVSYIHTPMRYAWDDCQKYTAEFGFPRFIQKIVPIAMTSIRAWDRVSAERVDLFIANSRFVARRIKKYYGKDATVIHPPVATKKFYLQKEQGEYFLMVGRLIAYKRHDIAIKAFNRLKLPLKIIGRGPEMRRLKRLSGSTIEFLGHVVEERLPEYYAQCRAFIFPQEEDFGIVAIEAMAAGKPLIAYRGGDIVEHLQEGSMGVFFEEQTPEAIVSAVKKFSAKTFDPEIIRKKALQFDRECFKSRIKCYIEDVLQKHKKEAQEGDLSYNKARMTNAESM